MKRFFALLFALLLAAPLSISRAATPPLKGPLQAVAWTAPPPGVKNVAGMIWISRDTDPAEAARQSREKPPGLAAIFLWDIVRELLNEKEDRARTPAGVLTPHRGVWPTHGIARMKGRVETFFAAYKTAGGRLDELVLDYEDGLSMWQMSPENIRAIQADPRSAAFKKQLGFDDFEPVINWIGRTEYLRWNAVTAQIVCDALNGAVFEPVHALYPGAVASNYGAAVMNEENVVQEQNGHLQWNTCYFGTHNSPVFYGTMGQLAGKSLDGKTPYGKSPLATLRWHVNTLRAIRRSSDAPLQPWIAYKNFGGADGAFRDNDYYQELLYHLALGGADLLLYWNPGPPTEAEETGDTHTFAHDRLVDETLAEINARLGDAPRADARSDRLGQRTGRVGDANRRRPRAVARLAGRRRHQAERPSRFLARKQTGQTREVPNHARAANGNAVKNSTATAENDFPAPRFVCRVSTRVPRRRHGNIKRVASTRAF